MAPRLAISGSALALGVATLLGYVATLYPSVVGGDSGELIAAVASGGVPHPPGYPLYALLTAPFTWLPIGTVAWRGNLASAAFAALAAALIAHAAMRMDGRWWTGIAAGALFAFTPTVWLYATSAEVFSLNNAIIATQLCIFAACDREPRPRLVYLGAFVVGLGISNHHTSAVFTVVLLAGMLWRTPASWRGLRAAATLIGCGAAGLLPYLYLPLASMRHAPIEWGDTRSIQGFVAHFLRLDYGTFQLGADAQHGRLPTLMQLGYYARDLARQISWIGVGVAAWGLVHTIRRRETRTFGVTTFAAYAAFLLVFHSLANLPLNEPVIHGVVARFWQAPNLLVCLWAGLGVAALMTVTRIPARARPALAIALVAVTVVPHVSKARHRDDYIVPDFGTSILNAAPPNALLLTRGDLITNTARYFNVIEGLRSDVRVVDIELLTNPWMTRHVACTMPDVLLPGTHYGVSGRGAYVMSELIAANIVRRPVLVCGVWKPGDPSAATAYRRLPIGFCDRLAPADDTVDAAAWADANQAAMPSFRNDMRITPAPDSWKHVVWTDYWEARHRRAYTLLMLALEGHADPSGLRLAAESFDQIIPQHPAPPPSWYKNLGIARTRLAATDAASVPLAIAALTHYLRYGPASDPERPAVMQTLREARRTIPGAGRASVGVD